MPGRRTRIVAKVFIFSPEISASCEWRDTPGMAFIILARMCMSCYGAWLYKNQIDTNRIAQIEPVIDGFGSVGNGPIEKSEYL
jgi:hypothetical protein